MARKRRQQQQFERAVSAHAQGRLAEAIRGYRRVLSARPRDHEVLHQLGVACWQEGDVAAALPLLESAVKQDPGQARYWSNLGNVRQTAGQLAEALVAYEASVALDPGRAPAWSGMGVALRGLGRLEEGIEALRRASALPGIGPAVWQNLASALVAAEQHAAAIDALRQALALDPEDGETHNALGNAHLALGRWAEARACYVAALQRDPDRAVFHTNLGLLLHRLGETAAAMDAFEAAIARDATYVDAYTHFGLLLRSGGHIEPAIATWQAGLSIRPTPEAWLNLANSLIELGHEAAGVENLRGLLEMFPDDVPARLALAGVLASQGKRVAAVVQYEHVLTDIPGHPEATHFLAALRQHAPERAPADYVRKLFDDYATRFEQHLVGELGYRTPQRLADLLSTVRPGDLGRVADLGCGTGLMGGLLRERCAHLVGVDLSSEMIHQARSKGIYDALHIGDIEAILPSLAPLDVLVAADVVIYIGEITGLLAQAAAALSPGGLVALTTEHLPGEGWRLLESGRYAHSHAAIAAAAEAAGLVIVAAAVEPIRQERGQWLDGELLVLQRP